MSIHISCDMYLRLGLHVQVRLYYVLPYKAQISAHHGIGYILDRCIVYLGLTMPNLQKKRLLIFKIFNIKKCTIFFGTEYNFTLIAFKVKSGRTDRQTRGSSIHPPTSSNEGIISEPGIELATSCSQLMYGTD